MVEDLIKLTARIAELEAQLDISEKHVKMFAKAADNEKAEAKFWREACLKLRDAIADAVFDGLTLNEDEPVLRGCEIRSEITEAWDEGVSFVADYIQESISGTQLAELRL